MKSLLLIASLLVSSSVFAQPAGTIGTMKASYLYCSSEKSDYTLMLDNAAIGQATGIQLLKYVTTDWKLIAKRPILATDAQNPVALPGHTSTQHFQYVGEDFVIQRDIINAQLYQDNLNLKIKLDGQSLDLDFSCSTVE